MHSGKRPLRKPPPGSLLADGRPVLAEPPEDPDPVAFSNHVADLVGPGAKYSRAAGPAEQLVVWTVPTVPFFSAFASGSETTSAYVIFDTGCRKSCAGPA